jgi:hypothetical protein
MASVKRKRKQMQTSSMEKCIGLEEENNKHKQGEERVWVSSGTHEEQKPGSKNNQTINRQNGRSVPNGYNQK